MFGFFKKKYVEGPIDVHDPLKSEIINKVCELIKSHIDDEKCFSLRNYDGLVPKLVFVCDKTHVTLCDWSDRLTKSSDYSINLVIGGECLLYEDFKDYLPRLEDVLVPVYKRLCAEEFDRIDKLKETNYRKALNSI